MEITEQSSTKRQKLIPGEDRLSSLPDHIICYILSFLPTKLSLRTSVLAKRWTFLWAHIPNLDFEHENHNSETVSISNIINGVMLRHKAKRLNTFRLSIENCNNYELASWITTLIDRNVEKLYMRLQCQDVLPPRLFSCEALVELSLRYCGTIPTNGKTVCLPALKKLCLDRVNYESDESLPRLISHCPVLEELTIKRDDEDNMICCYISSPTLSRLRLTSRFCEDVENEAYKLKLDTPALRYLRLRDSVSANFSVGALTSLTEAYLDLYSPMTLPYARSVLEFVSRLYNVEYLKLCTFEIEVPDSEFCVLTKKFHNLVKLELECDWRFITKLLESAENLQVLKIDMCNTDLKGWVDPKQVPACLVSRLRSVRIDNFKYSEDEVNVVRYFLRNAKVLELMIIYTYCNAYIRRDSKQRYDVRERISLFERGSEACELVFD